MKFLLQLTNRPAVLEFNSYFWGLKDGHYLYIEPCFGMNNKFGLGGTFFEYSGTPKCGLHEIQYSGHCP